MEFSRRHTFRSQNWDVQKMIFFSLLFTAISSCGLKTQTKTTLYYSRYKDINVITNKNEYYKSAIYLKDGTSAVCISNNQDSICYTEIIKNEKVFRKINNNIILSHNKNCLGTEFSDKIFYPFLAPKVYCNKTRVYRFENESIPVFVYGEVYSDDSEVISFYNSKLGFFCYYLLNEKQYITIDSVAGNNYDLKKLAAIKKSLFSDTTAFPFYHLKVLDAPVPPTRNY